MRATERISAALEAQRGHLIGWVPVGLAIGIGTYFGIRAEPSAAAWGAVVFCILVGALVARRARSGLSAMGWALLLVACGVAIAGVRAHLVAEPVLGFRYYGAIEGRIVKMDRSASDAVRLTLDRVVLERMTPERTPARVRVSLHGDQSWIEPKPGMTVILTGHLSPPAGPVEPGGFDFRRMSWFDGLGAVGYTRTPVLLLEPPAGGRSLWIYRARMAISEHLQARMDSPAGAVAAAVAVGDRSAIPEEVLEDLRASNLAHLLAISGLHMGLLTGFVFGVIRYGLALVPPLALRLDTKRIGAAIALIVGAAYLAMSGGNVATERAFIMVSVMLVAVLLGRRALTLRAVAIAATIVLLRRPEELTGPGFQMSFAATAALVIVFQALRYRLYTLPGPVNGALSVVLSSLIAGLATAPIAAAHFNQISHYGLIANTISVPVMGFAVMPSAVVAACLSPLGLEGPALWVMEKGLQWILAVAATVASWEGAVSHVPAPGPWTLPLLSLGAVWVVLWQGRLRALGAAPALLAMGLWTQAERPALLIADTGGLVGLMTPEGRALSKPKGDGFSADVWLENDGAPVEQAEAHERGAIARGTLAQLGPYRVLHVTGKRGIGGVDGCGGADILVTNVEVELPRPCLVLDQALLRDTGAVAVQTTPDGLQFLTVSEATGQRLWSPRKATGLGDLVPPALALAE